ncbi:hypothetical protein [Bacillus toyonensis]|uniref:hypothetical protein n=4 Tax=Bacillaceae TaxID=186817 RepID=UPI003008D3E1
MMNQLYNNIFHYYKGNSKQNEHELQFENNVTKALINVLQHSSPTVTTGFIKLVNPLYKTNPSNNYTYSLQIGSKLNKTSEMAVVLGIAEDNLLPYEKQPQRKTSIPDAAIICDDIAILIETKIGYDSKLSKNQLMYHKEKFHSEQLNLQPPITLTWNKIRKYFSDVIKQFTPDSKTYFLIKQFDEFCDINGIGGITHQHHFLKLPLLSREIAQEIDEYIWKTFQDVFEPPQTKRGIAYKRKNRRAGFGKLCTDRQCLILRFGPKGSSKGLEMQEVIDKKFGKSFVRKGRDLTGYTHETYIDYQVVSQLELLVPYIHQSYNETP